MRDTREAEQEPQGGSAQGTRAARAGRGGASPGLRVTLTCSATTLTQPSHTPPDRAARPRGPQLEQSVLPSAVCLKGRANGDAPQREHTQRALGSKHRFLQNKGPGSLGAARRSRIAVCAASFTEVDAVLQGPDPCLHQLARRKAGFITCCLAESCRPTNNTE